VLKAELGDLRISDLLKQLDGFGRFPCFAVSQRQAVKRVERVHMVSARTESSRFLELVDRPVVLPQLTIGVAQRLANRRLQLRVVGESVVDDGRRPIERFADSEIGIRFKLPVGLSETGGLTEEVAQ
jgi:hypothetical protein